MKRGKPGEQERLAAEAALRARFVPGQSTLPRVAALDLLKAQLVRLAQQYDEGGEENERSAVYHSVQAVQEILIGIGFPTQSTNPLNRVLVALMETARGRSDPLFTPKRRKEGGAPPLSLERMMGDGTLAALAQLWINANQFDDRTQPALLAEAARHIKGPWCPSVTGPQLATRLATARSEAADHPTRVQFGTILAMAERHNADPAVAFRGILAVCNAGAWHGFGDANFRKNPAVIPDE